MTNVLILTNDIHSFSSFISALQQRGDIEITCLQSGEKALGLLAEKPLDLVVTDDVLEDMAGLSFAQKLVRQYPLMNCAAVSRLSPHDFHEASEGLGLLMQLPPTPGAVHAEQLLEHLEKIRTLAT